MLEVSYNGTNSFPTFDGNGNLAGLVNAADGTIVASYEYGPFGEVIRQTGPMAKANPIRFSTKYQDDESDLLCYGYRYYKPSTGTWVSRDPSEETSGSNLYCDISNDCLNNIDKLGLFKYWTHEALVKQNVETFSRAHTDLGLSKACWDYISATLQKWDANQDFQHFSDLKRHFNRAPADNRQQLDIAYADYVQLELGTFQILLARGQCEAALERLGLITHSWQDFFAHAIRRDGKGGKENSDFPGWTAFSVGIVGTPENRTLFWPSSYSMSLMDEAEHPPFEEPVKEESAEGQARQRESLVYVSKQFTNYLLYWIQHCQCSCGGAPANP